MGGGGAPRSVESYLADHVAVSPASVREIERLRERAWQEQGVIVLRPTEIADEWTRQAVINLATMKWGRRLKP